MSLRKIILWPYYRCLQWLFRQQVYLRCIDLKAEGKELKPSTVFTSELIISYLDADLPPHHLEKAIRDNEWHEDLDVRFAETSQS